MERLSRDEVGAALELVAEDLERVERLIEDASRASTGFLTDAATHLTKAGGKRLRPALLLLSSRLGSGPNRSVYLIAAAVELTHMATLYHDDVIDDADLRRGVPSANEKWGNTVAILSGDYLFARASVLAAEVGGEIPRLLARSIAEVIQGQVRELEASFDTRRTQEHYLATIKGKTASLLEATTRVGAVLGDCESGVVDALAEFGLSFGYAFQIADDLLDLAATREDLGKPPGTDLRDGVYTLPVILALSSNGSLASRLAPNPDVKEVLDDVTSTGAFGKALAMAEEYAERAMTALARVPAGPARDALERLTRLIVERVPTTK